MMDSQKLSRKRAELELIRKEVEAERSRRLLPDAATRVAREERRLLLEREVAAASGEEYADELPTGEIIGDQWHLISNLGRDTVLLCGDVGHNHSVMFHFEHTADFRLSGLNDDFDSHPLIGRGLGVYGLFVVRNSAWRRESIAALSERSEPYAAWLSGFEHFILRGKGGDFSCLARGVDCRRVSEGIELLRGRALFWRALVPTKT